MSLEINDEDEIIQDDTLRFLESPEPLRNESETSIDHHISKL